MTELTVTIKTIDSKYTKKYLIYKTYTMDAHDPYIKDIVEETRKSLYLEPDSIIEIKVRATLLIQ